MKVFQRTFLGLFVVSAMGLAASAQATHVPNSLDVNQLWSLPGNVSHEGWLNFMTPGMFIPIPNSAGGPGDFIAPGGIATEEYTGWTDQNGIDFRDPTNFDQDLHAGDRADFDWVQENRAAETAPNPLVNHPNLVGAMGWEIAPTQMSPHIDAAGNPHNHGTLGELQNPDFFPRDNFNMIDVFSIISLGEDSDIDATGLFSNREAALDYELWFVDLAAGLSVAGVPLQVFVPGWNPNTTIDDYVTRWVPRVNGTWDAIAIEPSAGIGHDQVTEIDAIKAYVVPVPAAVWLLGSGLMGLIGIATRKKAA